MSRNNRTCACGAARDGRCLDCDMAAEAAEIEARQQEDNQLHWITLRNASTLEELKDWIRENVRI